jgi:hypothetical protein
LGVFGLLAHPELSSESPFHASGNYGMLDHCAREPEGVACDLNLCLVENVPHLRRSSRLLPLPSPSGLG